MANDDDVHADAPPSDRVGLTGARFRSRAPVQQARPHTAPARGDSPAPAGSPRFDTVLRGYSRSAVDAHLAGQDERIRVLEDALHASERRRTAAEAHAAQLEAELAAAAPAGDGQRPAGQPEQSPVGDGLLRLARREAARIRVEAGRAARQVLDEAHAEAARSREEPDQTAAAWTARVEQHLARRLTEVQGPRLPDPPER